MTKRFHPTKEEYTELLSMHCAQLSYGNTGKFSNVEGFTGNSVNETLKFVRQEVTDLRGSDCMYYTLPNGNIKILTPKRFGKRYRLIISKE